MCQCELVVSIIFFFNDTATTEIYTLSLHDALPICAPPGPQVILHQRFTVTTEDPPATLNADVWTDGTLPGRHRMQLTRGDRKSTRLNSSHANISYAVFCLKKKTQLPFSRLISRL